MNTWNMYAGCNSKILKKKYINQNRLSLQFLKKTLKCENHNTINCYTTQMSITSSDIYYSSMEVFRLNKNINDSLLIRKRIIDLLQFIQKVLLPERRMIHIPETRHPRKVLHTSIFEEVMHFFIIIERVPYEGS